MKTPLRLTKQKKVVGLKTNKKLFKLFKIANKRQCQCHDVNVIRLIFENIFFSKTIIRFCILCVDPLMV